MDVGLVNFTGGCMKFLDTLSCDVASDFEMLEFLKKEVRRLNRDSIRWEKKVQVAYAFGYDEGCRGEKFDRRFDIDLE